MRGRVFSYARPGAQPIRATPSRVLSRNVGRRPNATGDPQNDIIRKVLYPGNIRNKETPTGTWRPDVPRALKKAIPSKQAHETIERAWLLHQRHVRRSREAELRRKFESVRNAMESLRLVAPEHRARAAGAARGARAAVLDGVDARAARGFGAHRGFLGSLG